MRIKWKKILSLSITNLRTEFFGCCRELTIIGSFQYNTSLWVNGLISGYKEYTYMVAVERGCYGELKSGDFADLIASPLLFYCFNSLVCW